MSTFAFASIPAGALREKLLPFLTLEELVSLRCSSTDLKLHEEGVFLEAFKAAARIELVMALRVALSMTLHAMVPEESLRGYRWAMALLLRNKIVGP